MSDKSKASKHTISSMGDSATTNGAPGAVMQADYLIVGTGPAGASLAAFMASYGMDTLYS